MYSNLFRLQYDEYGNTREILVYANGSAVHASNFLNKGTAFDKRERQQLGLDGQLPAAIRTIEEQVAGLKVKLAAKSTDIEKYVFFRALFGRNATLAHALIRTNLAYHFKIIYTPTVGYAVQNYSSLFRQAHGVYLSPDNIDRAEDILRSFAIRDIRVAVVTDNQGILGLGDQGAGGMAVCLGKLMLYTQGAGIAPWHCLPICLDVGTDNEELLADEQYLGWRQRRLEGEEYLRFIGRFVRAFRHVFPDALCQWEDFSTVNAFSIDAAFRDELISFNDDIHGTGAAALATILSAMKVKKKKLTAQKFLVYGGGPAAVGVAMQIHRALMANGLSTEEASDKIFLLHTEGLVQDGDPQFYRQKFSKSVEKFAWIRTIDKHDAAAIIREAGITVLIGTTGQNSFFNEAIAVELKKHTVRPVVLLLFQHIHTPREFCHNVKQWAADGFLLASGHLCMASGALQCNYGASQCNSAMIFPGIALGVLVAGVQEVYPEFFDVAAEAVSNMMSRQEIEQGHLMPKVENVRAVAQEVALAVAMKAVEMDVARPCVYSDFMHNNEKVRMKLLIEKIRWKPRYLPMRVR